MPSYRTYQIIRSVKDLPPRDIKIFPLINPLDVDLVQSHEEIALDIEVDNQAAGAATVTFNDQDAFNLPANTAKSLSDVLIQRFRVSGVVSGQVIVNVISIALLRKLNAIEVR